MQTARFASRSQAYVNFWKCGMRAEALDLSFGSGPRLDIGFVLPVCERFAEVGVSRSGTANVLERLVADTLLNYIVAWLE